MNVADISADAAQVQADEAAVTQHLLTGKPLDPEIYRRVRRAPNKSPPGCTSATAT